MNAVWLILCRVETAESRSSEAFFASVGYSQRLLMSSAREALSAMAVFGI